MVNSFVEKEFINWCKLFGDQYYEHISALFIDEYPRYASEYSNYIEKNMTDLYSFIHNNCPNINFSLRGRFKSKRSFLIKSFCKLAENIEKVFSGNYSYDEKYLNRFFSFISNENLDLYNSITDYLKSLPPESDSVNAFNHVLSLLPYKMRNNLIRRLGRTEDTFAYKIIVHSVDYDIKNMQIDSKGKVSFVDSNNNIIPVNPSIKLNPNKDIHQDENGLKYIILDTGEKIPFNEHNLLFDKSVAAVNRKLENAKKDSDGNITMLGDSFVLPNGKVVDISNISYFYNFENNSSYIKANDKTIQLSNFNKDHSLKIRKYDEASLINATQEIDSYSCEFHKDSSFISFPFRRKDYITHPKPTGYQSIHNSFIQPDFGYTIESQVKTLFMEDNAKNEHTSTGHDEYKKRKLELKKESNHFISNILKR